MIQNSKCRALKFTSIAFLAVSISSGQTVSGGGIGGQVVDTQSKGVGGSFVMLYAELANGQSARDFKPFSKATTVTPEGKFEFADVPAGNYKLCAEATHIGYWNNCLWGAEVRVISESGKTALPVKIVIGKAEKIVVTVRDPKKLREDLKKSKLALTVWGQTRFGAKVISSLTVEKDDDKETVLAALVPGDRDVVVQLESLLGRFTDEGKSGASAEKSKSDYLVIAGDAKSRDIKVTLQNLKTLTK